MSLVLIRLLLGLLSAGAGIRATAQVPTNCAPCWSTITRWHGSYSASVTGSGSADTCCGQLNDSSQGTFDIGPDIPMLGNVSGTGSIDESWTCTSGNCTETVTFNGSGALDPAYSSVSLVINPLDCTYFVAIVDVITAQYTATTCDGTSVSDSYPGVATLGLVAAGGQYQMQPLPAFGENLSGSVTYTVPYAGIYSGPATVTLTWNIEPQLPTPVPPKFTQWPPGGSLGCNPTNIPDDATIVGESDALADSGQVAITATHVDSTSGCTTTRVFTLTAMDTCEQTVTHVAVIYSWTIDTIPPVLSGVPAGGNLGCNPANPPTDASVKGQVTALDNCSVPTVTVTHVDANSGCAVTRTFTITATDECGNVSPASTVVFTWTADTTPPSFTQLSPGGNLGTNPPTVPDDAAVRAMTTAVDNCGVASLSVAHADGGVPPQHSRTFTITAVDSCGNPATATVEYTWTGTAGTATGNSNAPMLTIFRVGTDVVISWPLSATGFSLQSRSSTTLGNTWTAVTNVPAVVDNQYIITNVADGRDRFYRLAN